MSSTEPVTTVKVRHFGWFGIGVAATLALTGVLFGLRASAAPSADEATFVPIAPCRLMDTRPDPTLNVGPRKTPLGTNETYAAQVTGTNGHCTIPAAATGVSLNVTAVAPTASSFMTIFPSDATRPTASNLNYVSGAPATPNKVDVKLSAAGQVSFYNLAGNVDVVADIGGYYTHQGIQDIVTDLAAKANAADVYTKADIDLALLRRQTFVGYVDTTGVKEGLGSFTSSRLGLGAYSVSYNFTGQNVPAAFAPMVIVASPSATCTTLGAAEADQSASGSALGLLTTMSFTIHTSNAGALADCGFSFIATFAGSNSIAIPVPSVAAVGGTSGVATPAG